MTVFDAASTALVFAARHPCDFVISLREDSGRNLGDDDVVGMAAEVSLRVVDAGNRSAVERLRVAADQENFVDGVSASLTEAAAKPACRPWYRAVYAGAEPVGFVMLADDVPPGTEDIPWRYYLWRMLIDSRFQGRGYGRAALDLVVDHLRTRPGADTLVTSIVAGEGSPLGFYLRYGFRATGEMFDHEHVLQLQLDEIRRTDRAIPHR